MNVLLDENFPLGLIPVLQRDGFQVDHVITCGWRGSTDSQIRSRLADRDLVFLTQDSDFLFGPSVPATIVVSRVRQARPLKDRIEVWRQALRELLAALPASRCFELTDAGELIPWQNGSA